MWQLSGIPCKLSVCAIWANREHPKAFFHPCYSREVYLATYNYKINPVPTHHEWVESKSPKIQPPKYHKQTGRQGSKEERQLMSLKIHTRPLEKVELLHVQGV